MTELFFPNQPETLMKQEKRIRRIAAMLPEAERMELYSALSSCAPSFAATTYGLDGDLVVASQCEQEIAFPSPVPMVKLALITFGYEQWLQRKYCLPGFVQVRAGDTVVDCGAYVGGFAMSAAKVAREVHLFEPDQTNAQCASRNLAGFDNVRVNLSGLYDCSGEMVLNISANSVEHSLLQPDDDVVVEQRKIAVIALADYAEQQGISQFDFVKIEAEGVELEVFAGLRHIRPRSLAIDVSPERDGQSPAGEFRPLLESFGYEVRQRGQVMFARK